MSFPGWMTRAAQVDGLNIQTADTAKRIGACARPGRGTAHEFATRFQATRRAGPRTWHANSQLCSPSIPDQSPYRRFTTPQQPRRTRTAVLRPPLWRNRKAYGTSAAARSRPCHVLDRPVRPAGRSAIKRVLRDRSSPAAAAHHQSVAWSTERGSLVVRPTHSSESSSSPTARHPRSARRRQDLPAYGLCACAALRATARQARLAPTRWAAWTLSARTAGTAGGPSGLERCPAQRGRRGLLKLRGLNMCTGLPRSSSGGSCSCQLCAATEVFVTLRRRIGTQIRRLVVDPRCCVRPQLGLGRPLDVVSVWKR